MRADTTHDLSSDIQQEAFIYQWAYRGHQNDLEALQAALTKDPSQVRQCSQQFKATPLLWAVAGGCVAAVTLLLKWKADPHACDDQGNTAVTMAASYGYLRVVQRLVELSVDLRGAQVGEALRAAAKAGHTGVVAFLLDRRLVSVDDEDQNKSTALSWSAQGGHLETVQCLLEHKADVNHQNRWGNTP